MSERVLLALPGEVIEVILENHKLTHNDVMNFAFTCKHLYRIITSITSSNKMWKTKFFDRWPLLKEVYADYEKQEKVQNWFYEMKSNMNSRKALMHQLSLMSAKYYKKQELSPSEFKDFDSLFRPEQKTHPLAYYFLVDELLILINHPISQSNLTNKYYAYKVLRYMKHNYVADEWHKFIKLPAKKQLLEQGATLVAQWIQPEKDVSYSRICTMLDDIVDQAKEVLKERYPEHPIFSTPAEQFLHWKNNNIDDNQWPATETIQIISVLREVMFIQLGFHSNDQMYYSAENSCIDKVLELKHGIPITLGIIFISICRRAGAKCEPTNYPKHFLLFWKERNTVPFNATEIGHYFIDIFNGGEFLTCSRISPGIVSSPIEVLEKMAKNLELTGKKNSRLNGRTSRLLSALELLHMILPQDTEALRGLAEFCVLYKMDTAKLVHTLKCKKKKSRKSASDILQMLQNYEKNMDVNKKAVEVKKRTPKVIYTIGMIMRHLKDDYLCVITGWDITCEASPRWMIENGVRELNERGDQPFYNVFVDDGPTKYEAQENLVMSAHPRWINHYEIGRYFSKFKGTHYVPIKEKAQEYPEDEKIRDQLLSQNFKEYPDDTEVRGQLVSQNSKEHPDDEELRDQLAQYYEDLIKKFKIN